MYRLFFLALGVFGGFSLNVVATPDCSQKHCSFISDKMNKFCISIGQAGKPYMVVGPDGNECYCPCSCMLADTIVKRHDQSFVEIQSIKTGESLRSPYSEFSENIIGKILDSDFGLFDRPGTVHHLHFSNGTNIVVSPDHTFVASGQKIVAAEELQVGQSIAADDEGLVQVVSNIKDNQFYGKLMNLIINSESPEARHHFLVTNSVISGDWLVQSNYSSFKTDIDIRLGKINLFQE